MAGRQFLLTFALLAPLCLGQDAQKPLGTAQVGRGGTRTTAASGDMPIVSDGLADFIRDKMKQWHCPGLAIGVIQGNETWLKASTYRLLSPR